MKIPKNIKEPFPITWVDIAPSNYRGGRQMGPDMIVMHIAEGSRASVLAQFKNPASEVSAHFLVCKTGEVVQFVSTKDVAFGNGVIRKPVSEIVLTHPATNPNEYSISIEHEGFATADITEAQYASSVKLVKFLAEKWSIPLDATHVIGHRQITGDRTCPGVVNIDRIIRDARY